MKKYDEFIYVKKRSGKTKIYADENIDSELIYSLREKYKINIITADELGFKGRDDDFQFKQAYKLKRFLLTCDWDFLDHKKFPFNQMIGIIILDIPNSFPGIGYIHVLLTNEVFPSGKEIEGTKIVVHKDTLDIHYMNESGKFTKQTFKNYWQ